MHFISLRYVAAQRNATLGGRRKQRTKHVLLILFLLFFIFFFLFFLFAQIRSNSPILDFQFLISNFWFLVSQFPFPTSFPLFEMFFLVKNLYIIGKHTLFSSFTLFLTPFSSLSFNK